MVYWERQGQDALCAVHALNSLLQGPYFTTGGLADIAHELDAAEQRLVGGSDPGPNYVSPNGAGNVDVSGNFSSQVLFLALQRWGELRALDSRHEAVRRDVSEHPQKEAGYICNLRRHWVALRRIPWYGGDAWFNLNSRRMEGPLRMCDAELTAFLAAACADGDTVFVVRGNLKLPSARLMAGPLGNHQMFLDDAGLQRLEAEELERQKAELQALAAGSLQTTPDASAVGATLQQQQTTQQHALPEVASPSAGSPIAREASSLPSVPPPWKAVWSDQHGKVYYWNTSSGATQWQHPLDQVPLDAGIAGRLLDLGRDGEWERLFVELEHAERGRQDQHGMRYVDFVPKPRRYGLLHYAAEQGHVRAVRALLDRFAAHPGLRTPEGLTALDVAWAAGRETALGDLRAVLSPQPQSAASRHGPSSAVTQTRSVTAGHGVGVSPAASVRPGSLGIDSAGAAGAGTASAHHQRPIDAGSGTAAVRGVAGRNVVAGGGTARNQGVASAAGAGAFASRGGSSVAQRR